MELAATIGKQLLEKDQQLEVKIEILELELEKTTEMVSLYIDLYFRNSRVKISF